MKKIAAILSASLLFNMLPITGFAFDEQTSEEGNTLRLEELVSATDQAETESLEDEIVFEETDELINEEKIESNDEYAIESDIATISTTDDEDTAVEEERVEVPREEWCPCLDDYGRCQCEDGEDGCSDECEDSCAKDEEGNCDCSVYVELEYCICDDPEYCECWYEAPTPPEEEFEETEVPDIEFSYWAVNLHNQVAITDNIREVYFPNVEITMPDEEIVYTIEVAVKYGTIMSETPVITVMDGVTVLMAKNLANTECVYTFRINGAVAGITREAAEELIAQVHFNRDGSQTMEITVAVDGRFTNIPAGTNLTAGKDSDGLGGHYYSFVPSYNGTWINAYNHARTLYYKGMQGYLVSVTRQSEEAVLTQISDGGAWTGGTRSTYKADGSKVNGELGVSLSNLDIYTKTFYWSAGPEAGHEFLYDGNGKYTSGSKFTVLNSSYYNPGTAMNNVADGTQAFLMMNSYGMGWNDLQNNVTWTNTGYFVEFGDDIVPTTGPSDSSTAGKDIDGDGFAQLVTDIPYVYVSFDDDMVYDGSTLVNPQLNGADEDTPVRYYQLDENGNKGEEITTADLINAGNYVVEIDIAGITITQPFEITPKPIYFEWTGGPYLYNSKEYTPTAKLVVGELEYNDGYRKNDVCTVVKVASVATKINNPYYDETDRGGIDAGMHIASVVELSNPNYMSAVDSTYTFEIVRRALKGTFTSLTAYETGDAIAPGISLATIQTNKYGVTDTVYGGINENCKTPGTYNVTVKLLGYHADNYYLEPELSGVFTILDGLFIDIFNDTNKKIDTVVVSPGANITVKDEDGNILDKYTATEDLEKSGVKLPELPDGYDYWEIEYDSKGDVVIYPAKEKITVTIKDANNDTIGTVVVEKGKLVTEVNDDILTDNFLVASSNGLNLYVGDGVTLSSNQILGMKTTYDEDGNALVEIYAKNVSTGPLEVVPAPGTNVEDDDDDDDNNANFAGYIPVYDEDGNLITKVEIDPTKDIIIVDGDGNIIGSTPASEDVDSVYVPHLDLDDGYEVEGWYAVTDQDGNTIIKPIITTPTMSESDFDKNDIPVYDANGNPVTTIPRDPTKDIIITDENDNEILRVPASDDLDALYIPDFNLDDNYEIVDWEITTDKDGNPVIKPVIVEIDKNDSDKDDNVLPGYIPVYDNDDKIITQVPVDPTKDIIITDEDGNEILRLPASADIDSVYVPELDLGDGLVVDAWYSTTDKDGNTVIKPIIKDTNTGDPGVLDGYIPVYDNNGDIITQVQVDPTKDIIIVDGDGNVITRIPASADTDAVYVPDIQVEEGYVLDGWYYVTDEDGNTVVRPIIRPIGGFNEDEPQVDGQYPDNEYDESNSSLPNLEDAIADDSDKNASDEDVNHNNDDKDNNNNNNSDNSNSGSDNDSDSNGSNDDEIDQDNANRTNGSGGTLVPQTNDEVSMISYIVILLAAAVLFIIKRKKI